MNISFYRRNECEKAKGLCVIIDVLRAFTTAAYAFHRGAKEIILVPSKEEAFAKLRDNPSLILIGEEHGLPIQGFHFGNSPKQLQNELFTGCTLVQRTSAGTQGVALCTNSQGMLLASFVVAESTISYIQALAPSQISFIITGTRNGDEDLAFAEYASERLNGNDVPLEPFLRRVQASPCGHMFTDPLRPELAKEDLDLSVQANRFSFAMEVKKRGSDYVAHSVETSFRL
jgi:2-phosphosulfolactate phosphatase